MSQDERVVVRGGGKNLYKISEHAGRFHVYHVEVGLISNADRSIGKTRSHRDALDLIKSHSGNNIQEEPIY